MSKFLNTKELSQLTGISASSLNKTWKNKKHELYKVLKKQGFDVDSFTKGIIPYESLYIILHYYSFESKYATVKAFESFSNLRFEKNGELFVNIDNKKNEANKYVYLFADPIRQVCKIGVTTNIYRRFKEIQYGYPFPLEITGVVKGGYKEEKAIHKKFDEYRIKLISDGEDRVMETEWFQYNKTIQRIFTPNL